MTVLLLSVAAWLVAFVMVKVADHVYGGLVSALFVRHRVALHPGLVTFSTTRWNNRIESAARRHRRFLRLWFSVGVALGFVGLFLSVIMLTGNLASAVLFGLISPFPASSGPRALSDGLLAQRPGALDKNGAAFSPWAVFQHVFSPRMHGSVSNLFWRHRHHGHKHMLGRFEAETNPYADFARDQRSGGSPKFGAHAQTPSHIVRRPASALDRQVQGQSSHTLPDESLRRPGRRTDSGNRIWRHGRSIEAFDKGSHRVDYAEDSAETHSMGSASFSNSGVENMTRDNGALYVVGRQILAQDMDEEIEKHRRVSDLAPNDSRRSLKNGQPDVEAPQVPRLDRPSSKNESLSNGHLESNDTLSAAGGAPSFAGAVEDGLPRARKQFLRPLVPGVTIPMSDVGYIAIAILLSAVSHELGHALAASIEEARVDSVGGFLALVFPGAYVQLSGMSSLPPFRQLRVYCAGAWHNVVLACICVAMASTLPSSLLPLYTRGHGAVVVSLPEDSALQGHLYPGDVVVGIGRHPVVDGGHSFRSAIEKVDRSGESNGFCISQTLYQKFAHPQSECCTMVDRGEEHATLHCFTATEDSAAVHRRMCMRASVVFSRKSCHSSADCRGHLSHDKRVRDAAEAQLRKGRRQVLAAEDVAGHLSSESNDSNSDGAVRRRVDNSPERCFVVDLPSNQKLVVIRVQSLKTGKVNHVYYQGYSRVLGQSMSVSSYVLRWRDVLPRALVRAAATWDFPNMFERQLQYAASISLALALLNMAPVFWLDGEASAILFVKLLLPRIDSFRLSRIKGAVLYIGTALLASNVLLAVIE